MFDPRLKESKFLLLLEKVQLKKNEIKIKNKNIRL